MPDHALTRRRLLALGAGAAATLLGGGVAASLFFRGRDGAGADAGSSGSAPTGSADPSGAPEGSAPIARSSEGAIRLGIILPAAVEAGGAAGGIFEAVAEAARMGAILAEEEHVYSAEIFGIDLAITIAIAADGGAASAAAEEIVAGGRVLGLVGGFGREQALAIGEVAEARRVAFMNVGDPGDSLRNELCRRFTFHVEPSAGMYLDALAGWFIRSGLRRWFFVHGADAEGVALYRRAAWSIRERHFGAREVGASAVATGATDFRVGIEQAGRASADVVLLLLPPEAQLAFLQQYEASGMEARVTGLPEPAAQTRTFFAASRQVAPRAGAGHRAVAWEATLDAYGARELNARFTRRWEVPMEPAAWAVYQGVKILYESALFGAASNGPDVVRHLESGGAVFDVWKGIGASFRPWDHQLRQSLYLVEIRPDAATPREMAMLVGELPAIYMPGTDPLERLDQIGDLEGRSRCRF